MSIYGTEEKLNIGNYQFEVIYDSGNGCGLDQRDVWVAERTPFEIVALREIPVKHLLTAYCGMNQTILEGKQQLEEANQQFQILRDGEHTQLKFRERRLQQKELRKAVRAQITAIEQALHLQLRQEPLESYDRQLLEKHYALFGENSFLRSFYFDEVTKHYILNFCRKYATDSQYRAAIAAKEVTWVNRNALFERNLFRITWSIRRASLPPKQQVQEARDFLHWLEKHTQEILALPEYQRIYAIDSAFEPNKEVLDPEIREAVSAWNSIPGVQTCFSCQGVTGEVEFDGFRLLTLAPHFERAYISFEQMDPSITSIIEQHLPQYPSLTATYDLRMIRSRGSLNQIESTGDNITYRRDILRLALLVQHDLAGSGPEPTA